jgi:hypothetical protein
VKICIAIEGHRCVAFVFVVKSDSVRMLRALYQADPERRARVNCCQNFGAHVREGLKRR